MIGYTHMLDTNVVSDLIRHPNGIVREKIEAVSVSKVWSLRTSRNFDGLRACASRIGWWVAEIDQLLILISAIPTRRARMQAAFGLKFSSLCKNIPPRKVTTTAVRRIGEITEIKASSCAIAVK